MYLYVLTLEEDVLEKGKYFLIYTEDIIISLPRLCFCNKFETIGKVSPHLYPRSLSCQKCLENRGF